MIARRFCLAVPGRAVYLILLVIGLAGSRAPAAPQLPILNWQPRSDWINVRTASNPAAMGDGVTDDTSALQSAFSRLHDGSVLYLPAGNYRITGTLTLLGPLHGILIVGQGRATRLVWDGPAGGHMLTVNGVAYSRFIGFELDGRGKAAAGLYHNSERRFETEVRHQHLALLNFTDAGLLVDPARKQALAETMFENCLFENCHRGASFTQFNDYDYTFDGCEFRRCDTGVECAKGNFYIRNCHFDESRVVDILASPEHGSSVRRCTSVGSNAFLRYNHPVSTMTIQDCHVSGWKSPDGAITIAAAPVMLFDCSFSHPPDRGAPVRVLRDGQRLIIAGDRSVGTDAVLAPGHGRIYAIPGGSSSSLTADQHFLTDQVRIPTRVFDARRDFGARSDGKTDDTAAVQRTIDAARAYGRDAIAYLPSGSYLIRSTLQLTGSNYFFGGSGWFTRLVWGGPEGGTIISVRSPHRVVLEQMAVGTHDAGAMNNAVDIEQTGTAEGSSITYDGVYVFGTYDKQPLRKGLRFTGLGPRDVVLMPHVDGNIHLVNCGQATVLADCSYEGSIVVEGTEPRREGMLGFLTRLTTICTYALYLRNNHSITMSDSYVEQADNAYQFEGAPGDPPGRATIQGAKLEFTVPKGDTTGGSSIDIRNYAGQIFLGHDQFYVEPPVARVRQAGSRPVDLFILACSFYNTTLNAVMQPAGHLYLVGSQTVGSPAAGAPDAADRVPPAGLAALVPALNDLRRLGALDLKLNHPGVTMGSSALIAN